MDVSGGHLKYQAIIFHQNQLGKFDKFDNIQIQDSPSSANSRLF
jgi:hypothetical protein